jgi:hypothetical protein
MPTTLRDAYISDYSIAMQKIQQSVVGTTQRQRASTWEKWLGYCRHHHIPETLEGLNQPEVPLLVFATRWRHGEMGKGDDTRGAASVSSAMAAVGKTIERMVNENPCHVQGSDKVIHQLRDLYATFRREDPAPKRAWPVPTGIILNLDSIKHHSRVAPAKIEAIRDLTILAFFYLLRPGEYAHTKTNECEGETLCSPFKLQDLRFSIPQGPREPTRELQEATKLSLNDLNRANRCTMVFSDQKNSIKGEYATHNSNGDTTFCPVRAAARRAAHLNHCQASGTTPIHTYYVQHKGQLVPKKVRSKDITNLLRAVAAKQQHLTGIPPDKLSARSLRAGGATAMLDARVDENYLRIFGRWRSDAMFHYFRTTSLTYTEGLSKVMLGNDYRITPHAPTQETPDLLPVGLSRAMLGAHFHYENGATFLEPDPLDRNQDPILERPDDF